MVFRMMTPKPPTGALNGEDGNMVLRGSAGRLARSQAVQNDPENHDRRNETGLDHFSSDGEANDDGGYGGG